VGVIAYQLLTGKKPFNGASDVEIKKAIKGKLRFNDAESWGNISKNGIDFVKGLMNPKPEERFSA
jgi:serine/threonine protein kinase